MALEKYIRDKLKDRSLLLMTHAVVGYPSLDDNWEMLSCMQEAGIDLVELQLPFSEPIADGPMFIKANQDALEHGLHWENYFDFLDRASKSFDFPILFMGYYNSVYRMGHGTFCHRLKAAGGQGYIIADLPPEDAEELDREAQSLSIDSVHIMTPVNSAQRLQQIAKQASGFVYCVARKGVTGKQTEIDRSIVDYVQRCRRATSLPVALGFGIKTAEHVHQLHEIADIAIVGTACLEVWEKQGKEAYRGFLKSLVEATR